MRTYKTTACKIELADSHCEKYASEGWRLVSVVMVDGLAHHYWER